VRRAVDANMTVTEADLSRPLASGDAAHGHKPSRSVGQLLSGRAPEVAGNEAMSRWQRC